jgi:ATP-dependent exoDNAse (exonuclease V) beta subunit
MSQLKIYKASAGSGKTYTLALEYIKELLVNDSSDNYRRILAVTFTKDATGEMKDRILAELYGLAFATEDSKGFADSIRQVLRESGKIAGEAFIRERAGVVLNHIIHDYSRLSITTIDSFFQKILRNLARELGLGSKFNIEMNTAKIRADAVKAIVENAHLNPQLLSWMTTYVENKLEQDDNWRFKDEVYRFSSCIYDEFFQEHEQALQYQLDNNPSIFNDLKNHHQFLLKQYRDFFRQTYQKVSDLLIANQLDSSDFMQKGAVFNFWRNLAENKKVEPNKTLRKLTDDPENWSSKSHKRKADIISLAENHLYGLLNETLEVLKKQHTSKLILGNIHQLGLVWYITKEINNMNEENNRFMLSDTSLFLNQMIDDSDSPFIYEKIGAEIRHVMIDEFQDTSRLQWKNFKSLLSDILSNNYFSMIVGDVKQSIYRWRNGDWRILDNIGKELSVRIKTLDRNYRSEKQIISFNNLFFTQAGTVLDDKFKTELTDLSDSPFASVYKDTEVCQTTGKTTDSGFVSIDFLRNNPDKEEEKYKDVVLTTLLEKLQWLHESKVLSRDICILCRNNSQIKVIAEFLSSLRDHHPELAKDNYLSIVSNEAFRLDSSIALRIIMGTLKVIAYPHNPVFRATLEQFGLEHPQSYLSDETPIPELISAIYRFYHLENYEGQSAYLFCFFDSITHYLNENPTNIHAFIDFWEDELSKKTIPVGEGIEGIRAMTIHKSKGLQFHTVMVPYCTWELNPQNGTIVWCNSKKGHYDLELLPVNYSDKMSDTVFSTEYQSETALSWLDNLNLLYVAFTRAKQNLLIFGKYKKTLAGQDNIKTVSDILQWTVPELTGNWNRDTLHFESGYLENKETTTAETDNLLKQIPPPLYIRFVSEEFQTGKSIFKQSNKSRDFVNPDSFSREKYIEHGNIMHALFANIQTLADIENAVDKLIFDGLLLPSEKKETVDKMNVYVRNSGVEDWFSGKYSVYSELSVIVKENGTVTTKRPDRVLLSNDSTIVVDYKFGAPHDSHQKQVQEYVSLLKGMDYPNVEGYLWYVEEGRKLMING